jgi:hypothetical protein
MGSIARSVTSVAQPVSGGSTSFPTGGMFGSGLGQLFSQFINQGALTPATGLPVTTPTPVTPPVTPATPMSPIRRFNAVIDPRLLRPMSRPMFRTSRYDGAIDQLLERLGIGSYATGGRVKYQDGGSSKTPPKFIPMDLESVAKRLFGRNLDNLTYNEKQTIYDYIEANRNKKANGGRIGYEGGGPISLGMELYLMAKKTFEEQGYNSKEAHEKALEVSGIKSVVKEYGPGVKKAEGGIMDLGGNEMDLRAKGGFVPIGKKEKADDVPARLSKNEFVFTAKAVRGAGKGDVRKGAKKMYQLMRQYEAMV